MQFYFLAASIFVILPGKYSRRVLAVVVVLAITLFLVSYGSYNYPAKILTPYLGLFAVGSVIHTCRISPSRIIAIFSVILFVGICLALIVHPTFRYILIGGPNVDVEMHSFNELFSFFGALMVMPYIAHSLSIKSTRLDWHLGNLAYPIYLFHMTPISIYRSYYGDYALIDRFPFLLVTYAVILVGAILIYIGFDRPLDSIRRQFVS